GSSERMEPPGGARHRWENREVEWSFWKSDIEGKTAREGASFKWAGAHESMRATSEFQDFGMSPAKNLSQCRYATLHLEKNREREARESNFSKFRRHSAFYADRCTVDLSCWYADAAH